MPATGVLAATNLEFSLDVTVMKAPVAFWPCTVARAHGLEMVTVWAAAKLVTRMLVAITNECVKRFMGFFGGG
jgi:hypothetical protein